MMYFGLLFVVSANLLLKVDGVSDNSKDIYNNVILLIQDILSFYKSSGAYLVVDTHEDPDWRKISLQLRSIRLLSRKYISSQAIGYDNLEELSKDRHRGYSRPPLFVVLISDTENLEHFQLSTRNSDISAYSWFVLISNRTGIDCESPEGNPFNLKMDTRMIAHCWENNNIKKFYSIFENTTEVVELAIWTPGSELVIKSDDDVLQLNKNMKGATLKAAVRSNTAASFNQNWAKYLLNLTRELESIANLTINITVEDNSFGYQDKNTKEWFGLIKAVAEKKADIVIALLSMSNNRLQVVDFSIPLVSAHTRLYARLPDSTIIHWSAYFRVFDKYSWMTLGLTILVLSAALGLTKNQFQRPYFNSRMFFGNLINVWGIYTQQGLPEPPNNMATQMLCFWILISSLIINALYSASITSYITVLTTYLPFSTIEEFLNSDYQLIVLNGSGDEDLILHNDPLLGVLKSRLRTNQRMPTQPYEGFEQACGAKIAYYSDEVSFSGSNQILPCILGSLQLSRVEWMSLVLAKDSPYTETLNYYILRLMNNGITQRLKSKYLYKLEEISDSNPNVVTLWEVVPILAIWMIGVITAFIVFCLEIRVYNYCRNVRATKRQMKTMTNLVLPRNNREFRFSEKVYRGILAKKVEA